MKQHGVKFYELAWSALGNVTLVRVGVSDDGIIWVDPAGVGVRPSDVDPGRFNGPVALVDARENRIYINARALVEMLTEPEDREGMSVCMGRLEQLLRENRLLPEHDSLRNN
jgi:hypothetical protein